MRYRLLQAADPSSQYARGVAYERDGKVLYFTSSYRGSAQLPDADLEHLRDSERPAVPGECWLPVQTWDETVETFMPHKVLRRDMSLPGEQSFERPNSEAAGPRRWKSIVAVGCAVLLVLGVLLLFSYLSRPSPVPDPLVFARDVYIFLDVTKSLNYAREARAFEDAKNTIIRRILPNVGPGDRVFCYVIGTDFVESQNRVFGGAMSPVPESLLAPAPVLPTYRKTSRDTAGLWEPVYQALNPMGGGWPLRVGRLQQQKGGDSNYLAALDYVAERLKSSGRTSVRESYVIVLGDLIHEPVPVPFVPPSPSEDSGLAFKGAQVELVAPFRVETKGSALPNRQKVREFWQAYFAHRGNEHPNFYTMDTAEPLLPVSPVPKPTEKQSSSKDK